MREAARFFFNGGCLPVFVGLVVFELERIKTKPTPYHLKTFLKILLIKLKYAELRTAETINSPAELMMIVCAELSAFKLTPPRDKSDIALGKHLVDSVKGQCSRTRT